MRGKSYTNNETTVTLLFLVINPFSQNLVVSTAISARLKQGPRKASFATMLFLHDMTQICVINRRTKTMKPKEIVLGFRGRNVR